MAVYTWGLGKTGQLGTGKFETEHIPQHIKTSAGGHKIGPVSDISCGALFSAILTTDGSLYTTGYGKYGRLGLGVTDDVCHFSQVKTSFRAVQVSCGSWHAVAVSDSGQVFIWGYKKACGEAITEQGQGSMLASPCLVSFKAGITMKGVSCGHNYTFAWTADGQLFSWGSGHFGILGHGTEMDVCMPTKVEQLSDKMVVAVGAGHDHCGIVTNDGLLFMTGKGSDGALGLGQSRLSDALFPVHCPCQWEITAVSCSKGEHHAHTLALTVEGRVLAWGDGTKGKLGLGDQDKRYVPTLIPPEFFNNEVIASISAGGIHSAAATTLGSVYTWGCGSDGRLGHPEGQGHRFLFQSKIPKKVERLPANSYARVSAAYYHTAAIIG